MALRVGTRKTLNKNLFFLLIRTFWRHLWKGSHPLSIKGTSICVQSLKRGFILTSCWYSQGLQRAISHHQQPFYASCMPEGRDKANVYIYTIQYILENHIMKKFTKFLMFTCAVNYSGLNIFGKLTIFR